MLGGVRGNTVPTGVVSFKTGKTEVMLCFVNRFNKLRFERKALKVFINKFQKFLNQIDYPNSFLYIKNLY